MLRRSKNDVLYDAEISMVAEFNEFIFGYFLKFTYYSSNQSISQVSKKVTNDLGKRANELRDAKVFELSKRSLFYLSGLQS